MAKVSWLVAIPGMSRRSRHVDIAERAGAREALIRIAEFGGLTSRQLARLLWQDDPSGLRLAQRLLQELDARKLLLRRRLPNGGVVYVLSQKAGYFLREQGIDDAIIWGHRHLRFDKPMHRMICNEVAIDHILEDDPVWPEFMVQRGLAPVPRIVCKGRRKIPDLVIQTHSGMVWVEVENSFKSQARLSELTHVCSRIIEDWSIRDGSASGRNNIRTQMLFIAPSPERLAAVVRAFVHAVDTQNLPEHYLGRVGIRLAGISPRYAWKGLSEWGDIELFLNAMKSNLRKQKKLHGSIPVTPIDPRRMTIDQLVHFMIAYREALGCDPADFSEACGRPITSYHDLEEELLSRLDDINVEPVIKEAQQIIELMNMNIGNNRESIASFFSYLSFEDA